MDSRRGFEDSSFFVGNLRYFAVDVDIFGVGGKIETKIGDVVTTIMEGRIGAGFNWGVMKFDGDLVGNQIVLEGNDMASFPLDVGVGFVGAKVGFNQ